MYELYLIVLSAKEASKGIDPAVWIALIGTLFGGVGLKLAESWLGRNRYHLETQQNINKEYRDEIKDLKQRLQEEETREQMWREKYWDLRQQLVNAGIAYHDDETEKAGTP